MKEALFYIKEKDKTVICNLCPHACKIVDATSGFCGIRENIDGILYTKTYNKISSFALDPIEKSLCEIISQAQIFYQSELLDVISSATFAKTIKSRK